MRQVIAHQQTQQNRIAGLSSTIIAAREHAVASNHGLAEAIANQNATRVKLQQQFNNQRVEHQRQQQTVLREGAPVNRGVEEQSHQHANLGEPRSPNPELRRGPDERAEKTAPERENQFKPHQPENVEHERGAGVASRENEGRPAPKPVPMMRKENEHPVRNEQPPREREAQAAPPQHREPERAEHPAPRERPAEPQHREQPHPEEEHHEH